MKNVRDGERLVDIGVVFQTSGEATENADHAVSMRSVQEMLVLTADHMNRTM